MQKSSKEDILKNIVGILGDMTEDWDMDYSGGINADTRLIGDLAFESIEIVQLMVAIEQKFNLKNIASEKLLMRDGHYVPELRVSEIVNFLAGEMK